MGWSIGYDERWKRDIGYGVPAICDHPDCNAEIDRGLAYVCGDEPYGGEHGCGLFFCQKHKTFEAVPVGSADLDDDECDAKYLCQCCSSQQEPFTPKPDTSEWLQWKLTDESWQQWRDENPEEVKRMKQHLEVIRMPKISKQDLINSTLQVHGAGEYVSKTYALSLVEQLEDTNKKLEIENQRLKQQLDAYELLPKMIASQQAD